jgi:Flp pilus assembly protein TadG
VPKSVKNREDRRGQVIVEMMLILPVFFTIIFSIMEMGNIAFQMIVLNHATWEVARIGAMYATPPGGGNPQINGQLLQARLQAVLPQAKVYKSFAENTTFDPQAMVQNSDLVITSLYPVPLIFPISSFMFSKPKGSGKREVYVTVRMPIERPLLKSL